MKNKDLMLLAGVVVAGYAYMKYKEQKGTLDTAGGLLSGGQSFIEQGKSLFSNLSDAPKNLYTAAVSSVPAVQVGGSVAKAVNQYPAAYSVGTQQVAANIDYLQAALGSTIARASTSAPTSAGATATTFTNVSGTPAAQKMIDAAVSASNVPTFGYSFAQTGLPSKYGSTPAGAGVVVLNPAPTANISNLALRLASGRM
jgi:hypothetical protein